MATVIRLHPEFRKIRVEGHTDDRGADDVNKALSQQRAQAVVDYLIGRGIEADRLEAVGFGEERPMSSNRTASGRRKNRRVEFKIVRTQKGPTNVELGCPLAKQKGVNPPPP